MANNLFTNEEFQNIKSILAELREFLPEHQAPFVWDCYQKINPSVGNRPCYCSSSAKYWRSAIDTLRGYVNENGSNYGNDGQHTDAV